VKTIVSPPTQKTNEKTYDSPSKKSTKIEPLQLNLANDHQQSSQTNDARRDEGVNTIDSTFRRCILSFLPAQIIPFFY
jgi:hypothetical protein